jgi:hypothetical protein
MKVLLDRSGTIGFPGSHDEGTALQVGGVNPTAAEVEKLILAKKRMAIAAFTSDAGWYLLAGDEILSEVAKSPFVRQNGSSFVLGAERELDLLKQDNPIRSFITSVNNTFMMLRIAKKVFWFEIFFGPDRGSFMHFVRHLGKGGRTPTDIVTVNLLGDRKFPEDKDVLQYLKETSRAEIFADDIRFFNVG